ncbi:hypothetical protein [Roseibium sp.]
MGTSWETDETIRHRSAAQDGFRRDREFFAAQPQMPGRSGAAT